MQFFQVWIQGAFPFKGSFGDTKSGTGQTLIYHCYKHLTWSAKHTACRQCTVQLAAALPFNKAELCAGHTTLLKECSCDGFLGESCTLVCSSSADSAWMPLPQALKLKQHMQRGAHTTGLRGHTAVRTYHQAAARSKMLKAFLKNHCHRPKLTGIFFFLLTF